MRKLLFLFIAITFLFLPSSVSAQIYTTDKMITVDRGKQMLYAWEGGRIINQTPVSTGMYYTPTIKGSFSIRRKVPMQDMKGSYPPYPPYHIKNVPNVMYFYGAYAIHGTYWHNSFGYRASHGCVNVPVAFSQWLYNWADMGTRVEVF
jgi:lipoprotein-anchoring transpeptidase ErfK/SrfK